MASFWDLLPASAWPVQPFIPPFDPTQARAWPPAALPQWTPANPSACGWSTLPAAAAGTPLDATSALPWESAMPQRLATQAGATGEGDAVDDDPQVAEAKRAYDFARWMFGPPSAPQRPSMRATALTGAPRNASPPRAGDDDQPRAFVAATGNPNIERQGARASQQPPSSFWDLLPAGARLVQPFIPPLDPTQPSAWSEKVAPPQWSAANRSAFVAARNAVPTSGDAQTLLADNSATPVAASQMSTPGLDDASNAAPSPKASAGATYNPLTWTAADNPVGWMQQLYERRDREFAERHPERVAAMKRMADTRLGDVPSIDAPNAARRMADGFAFGYGNVPTIPYQDIEPDTKIAGGGYALPDWAQPDAKFLWRSANVAPELLDRALRALRGGAYGAAGAAAGLYQDLGGSEAWADRLQRDLGIGAQYPLTDMSLVRPMALEPQAPARALETNPRDIVPKAPLADSGAPASAPRSLAGPNAALDVGPPSYTREQADLLRNYIAFEPERFRGTVGLNPPAINGSLLDQSGAPMGRITSTYSPATGVAYHDFFELGKPYQNLGISRDINRARIAHYRQRGLSRVELEASLDNGGYAWARYGFLPSQASWDALRPVLRDKIRDPSLDLTPVQRQEMLDLAGSRDPHAIWDIADNRTPAVIDGKPVMLGDKPLPLGNHLLSGTNWAGSLDLNDAEQMDRFDHYVDGAKK